MRPLAQEASQEHPFFPGTLRELSVGLCRDNFLIHCAIGGMLAQDSGRGFRASLAVPTDEGIE
jgi:hypothetical protein